MKNPTLTVPPEDAADLRSGLLTELGIASAKIANLSDSPGEQPREEYEPWRELLKEACGALDEIGWTTPSPPAPIEIDLASHRAICRRSLEGQLRSYAELMDEMPAAEQRRATERVQQLHALVCALKPSARPAA